MKYGCKVSKESVKKRDHTRYVVLLLFFLTTKSNHKWFVIKKTSKKEMISHKSEIKTEMDSSSQQAVGLTIEQLSISVFYILLFMHWETIVSKFKILVANKKIKKQSRIKEKTVFLKTN